MAIEKILNTRIKLKIATATEWGNSTLELKKGEAAISTSVIGTGTDAKTIAMIKVADTDGQKWKDLQYTYALAADVPEWLKAASSPDIIEPLVNTDHWKTYEFSLRDEHELPEDASEEEKANVGKLVITEKSYNKGKLEGTSKTVIDVVTPQELGKILKNYYTKDQIDAFFANYYTKEQIDDLFENYYTKSEVEEDYKKVQTPVTETGSTTKTITSIKQDKQGKITEVVFEDISHPALEIADDTGTDVNALASVLVVEDVVPDSESPDHKIKKKKVRVATAHGVEEAMGAIRAHNHVLGKGTTVNSAGGLSGDNVQVDLNIKMELVEDAGRKYLAIFDSASTAILDNAIAKYDVAEFITDGMLEDAAYDDTAKTITFTWNTAAGSKTDVINIGDLVDEYTAGDKIKITPIGNVKQISHAPADKITPTPVADSRKYITKLEFDGYGHVKTIEEADLTWSKYEQTAVGNLDVIKSVQQDETGKVTATVGALDLSNYATLDKLVEAANDGKLTFVGEDKVISITGAEKFTANQAGNSEFTISLAAGAITETKLATDSVSTTKIVDKAVTTAKIDDVAVTAAKLAADAVTTAKIADAAVTSAKVANHSISAHHTKACKDYAGDDAEVWVFDCGGAV